MTSKYFMPTRVVAGRDCIVQNSDLFRPLGKKALIVTGAHSAKNNGSEKDVKTALDSVGISYLVFDKVMSNPSVACAYEGAGIARSNDVDFIIAIGGGSPMDAGKAIALLAAQEIEEEDLFSGKYDSKVLPMAFVPTTAGTGAEVTQYSILTNDRKQTKTSISFDLLFPSIAFLDAKYMEHLSIETTINTAVDALSHAVEGMMSVRASVISNALAAESIRMIMCCVPEILDWRSEKNAVLDANTREQLLQASFLAGTVIAQTGTTAVHAMGYSLTYFKDVDHGRANGLLLGEFMRFTAKRQPELIGRIIEIMNLQDVDQFIDVMDILLGEKETISPEDIRYYSSLAIQTRNIGNCVVTPVQEDLQKMYEASFS